MQGFPPKRDHGLSSRASHLNPTTDCRRDAAPRTVQASKFGDRPGQRERLLGGADSKIKSFLVPRFRLLGVLAMRRIICTLVALAFPFVMTGSVRADYDIIQIDVPGASDSWAVGINDAGQIVGIYA